ncbi:MAG: hypothetical protein AB9891_01825 [Anaerolineaceae bacterium]
MKNNKSILLAGIVFILLLTLACSMSEETQPDSVNAATKVALTVAAIDQPAGQQPVAPAAPAGQDAPAAPQAVIPTLAPTLPPSLPTSFQSTFASLDSYTFIMKYNQITKNAADNTIIEMTMNRSEEEDAFHAIYRMQNPIRIAESEASSEPQNGEVWSRKDATCSKDEDGKYETQKAESTETDNTKDLIELMDILPRIENPEFVGTETVNDTPCNHFKFKIANYMADSGWLVTRNEGDYWLALDGQYLVKYVLYLDASSAPEGNPKAESNKISLIQELKNINQPIDVSFPAECPPPS